MVTITFDTDRNDNTLQRGLNYLKSLGLSFHINEAFHVSENTEEEAERLWVQSQLHKKYVETHQWQTMDDEDRQDAVLAETLLYIEQKGDNKPLSVAETQDFLEKLKTGVL
jgi:hypothetical protein